MAREARSSGEASWLPTSPLRRPSSVRAWRASHFRLCEHAHRRSTLMRTSKSAAPTKAVLTEMSIRKIKQVVKKAQMTSGCHRFLAYRRRLIPDYGRLHLSIANHAEAIPNGGFVCSCVIGSKDTCSARLSSVRSFAVHFALEQRDLSYRALRTVPKATP
jgi:hypothetical protein